MKKSLLVSAGLLLALGAHAVVQDSVTFTNIPSLAVEEGAPEVRSHNSTVTGYTLGKVNFTGELIEAGAVTGDFLRENLVEVTSPSGAIRVLAPVGTSYVGPIAVGPVGFGGFSGLNPVGTWGFRFQNSFRDAVAGAGADATWNSFTFNLTDDAVVAPTPVTDLGNIGDTSSDYDVADLTHNAPATGDNFQWFKFNIGAGAVEANSTWLDIDTCDSANDSDTEIGMFDTFGTLVALDDDSGSGFESMVTFGVTTPVRVLTSPVRNFDGDGFNGDIPAGTYYMAIGEWNMAFADDFGVTTDGTPIPLVINFRTNIPAGGGASISGAVVLADWTGATAGRSVDFEVFSGATSVQTASATLDAGGNFSFPTTLANGNYNLIINANRGWLKKKVAITVTGGSATVASTTVKNGDIVDDGVVDLTDYTAVATGFNGLLSDPNNGGNPSANWNALADVNGDGVIDLTDYTVVATNFNSLDDAP